MAIIAMVSAKGSPGVTTAALACTLSWFRPVVLAECDPAGGDLRAGYLGGLEIPPIGLLPLAVAELRDQVRVEFPNQLVDLDNRQPGRRLLLPGLTSPVQSGTVAGFWGRLGDFFAGLEGADPGYDVIADCGRLATANAPWALLHRADVVLLVVRATSLRTISPAVPAVEQLRQDFIANGRGASSLAVLLVGSGPYPRREIEKRLQLPVLGELPLDDRTATVLSDGGRLRKNAELLRSAASLDAPIRQAIANRRISLRTPAEVGHG